VGLHRADAWPVDIEELFMKLSDNYLAVGASTDAGSAPCVVIVTATGVIIRMPEHEARKLADDILRNANYLWPMDEENT